MAITKSRKALHAISLIKRYFNKNELLLLVTSNYYSILYYNSEIWHIPSLSVNSKKLILSASARALKICTHNYNRFMSYATIHSINNRATPDKIMKYKTSLTLHKIYNTEKMSYEWQQLFLNQNFNDRNSKANFLDLRRRSIRSRGRV